MRYGIRFSVMVIQRLFFVWEDMTNNLITIMSLKQKKYIDEKMESYW